MPIERFVLDTNVLVSALLFPESPSLSALGRAEATGVLLMSLATFAEFEEVLMRTKFDRYVSRQRRDGFVAALASRVQWVETRRTISVCRDPKDDKFLEVAMNGNATHIVTGDQDLLILNPFHGIRIQTPRQFVDLEDTPQVNSNH